MLERAGNLPGEFDACVRRERLTFGALHVDAPAPTPEQASALARRAAEHAERTVGAWPVARVVDALDRTVERLLDRSDPQRRRMDALLPVVSGYDAEMVGLGLSGYLKTFRRPELLRFIAEDFPNPGVLDGFQPLVKGGFGRAYGPRLLAHIWAGNMPGLPLWTIVAGLLVKSGGVGKVASGEPLFAGWFMEALGEVEPDLKDCLAVVWWRGGDAAVETALFAEADVALAYGGDDALQEIKARAPATMRFLGFGHKVSFAVVAATALDAAKAQGVARRAAYDVARYDQQGCFAPHMAFVERGGAVSPARFAELLAAELKALQAKFPRRALSLAEAAGVADWRAGEEMADGGRLISCPEGAWSVSVQDADKTFRPSGLNRAVRIVAVDALAEVAPIVAPYRPWLQTVGVAATPRETFDLANALGAVGVTRIAALGDMTAPEAGWHHDGRFNLADLVRMVEIDQRAEAAADALAAYHE